MISITTSRQDQVVAAHALSKLLTELGCSHAYIGGFAWSLLGSERPTEHDIDILIETKHIEVEALREQISELDVRFAKAGFKLYFVKEPGEELRGQELVCRSKNNVLIETLAAGTLGLPIVAGPTYSVSLGACVLHILHPRVLILTKMKRWAMCYTSTRPKTLRKNRSDQKDIEYIIYWLAEKEATIGFDEYQGKAKVELLSIVWKFHDKFVTRLHLMEKLQRIVLADDWKAMFEFPVQKEV